MVVQISEDRIHLVYEYVMIFLCRHCMNAQVILAFGNKEEDALSRSNKKKTKLPSLLGLKVGHVQATSSSEVYIFRD